MATKIPESLLGVLMSVPLRDCHTPHHATQPKAYLLSRGASTKGTVPQKTFGITCDLSTTIIEQPFGESC